MDFNDSPEEAAFRREVRAWARANKPDLPPSTSNDELWERHAEWHRLLYDAGFFGLTWPEEYGGRGMDPVYDVIVDEELAAAGAPFKPDLGYLVHGISTFASQQLCKRFLPGLLSGRERWCQGFSEPDAGSDLASLRTTAVADGDDYVLNGHKIWTSHSEDADWCLVLARTNPKVAKHKGITAFIAPMDQPGIKQIPIRLMNGVSNEFGEVLFHDARVPASNIVGEPGRGWPLAMTIVSYERDPSVLGYVARYSRQVADIAAKVAEDPGAYRADQLRELARARVFADILQSHVRRRLSERRDATRTVEEGSIDKLIMTWTDQTIGHAALRVGGLPLARRDDTRWLNGYLYSRAMSVMGGTAQIQKNIVAQRILGLPA